MESRFCLTELLIPTCHTHLTSLQISTFPAKQIHNWVTTAQHIITVHKVFLHPVIGIQVQFSSSNHKCKNPLVDQHAGVTHVSLWLIQEGRVLLSRTITHIIGLANSLPGCIHSVVTQEALAFHCLKSECFTRSISLAIPAH